MGEVRPRVADTSETAEAIRQISGSPMTLFVQVPLADDDLARVTVSTARLTEWLRIETIDNPDGTTRHSVFIDENAVRNWLLQYEPLLYREPVDAQLLFRRQHPPAGRRDPAHQRAPAERRRHAAPVSGTGRSRPIVLCRSPWTR